MGYDPRQQGSGGTEKRDIGGGAEGERRIFTEKIERYPEKTGRGDL